MLKQFIKKLIPGFALSWYHFVLAFLAGLIYRFPGRKLKVIGITGTNGKTTTVNLTTQILERAGYKVASVSSIKFKLGGQEEENMLKMTMPGRFKLQKFLRKAVRAGCRYAVLEITSEGILQHRHRFIDFDTVVFTNLSPEHIERHGGFENYKKAKGKLFKTSKKIHIINLDDKNAKYFLQFPAKKKFCFTLRNKKDSVHITPLLHSSGVMWTYTRTRLLQGKAIEENSDGLSFSVENVRFHLNLIGRFNIYNALAAISVALSQNVPLKTCREALAKAKGVPGRMEKVISAPFKVFVDYAFTPNALEKVYQTLRTTNYKLPTTNLICVLGACGGGRDKWKRPVLGKIAAKYCQQVIVTNEDPYDENPMKIISQVAAGASKFKSNPTGSGKRQQNSKFRVQKILDRREAIKKALRLAKPGDTVVITGKGSEPWLCVENGKKIPWDDRKVVREEYSKLNLPL